MTAAVAVSVEKDRRTLELLPLAASPNRNLYSGSCCESLRVMLMPISAIPVFGIATFWRGNRHSAWTALYCHSCCRSICCKHCDSSIGKTTFQAVAITAFAAVLGLLLARLLQRGLTICWRTNLASPGDVLHFLYRWKSQFLPWALWTYYRGDETCRHSTGEGGTW